MNTASLSATPTKRQAIRAAAQAAILLYRAGIKDQARIIWRSAIACLEANHE